MNNDRMDKSLLNTIRKIESLDKNGSLFKLGFITDVHTGGNSHFEALKYFSESFLKLGYDCAINGGDIGLDLGESMEETNEILENTSKAMKQDIPFLFTKGNHDYGTQKVGNGMMNRLFCEPSYNKFPDNVNLISKEDGGGYGTYINKDKKVLIIFINTSEGDTRKFTMSDSQLSFIKNTLESIKDGYRVIVSGHLCIHECGSWKSYPMDNKATCFIVLKKMLSDFDKKCNGSMENLKWNFESVPKDTRLVCYLSGDSHFNNYAYSDGVNYVVRQGYGGVDPKEMPIGATHDIFSSNDGVDFDLYSFDSILIDDRKCYIVRCGAGEKIRDLEFEF